MFKDIREEQKKANERKLLEAKLYDKYKFAVSKNKITNTDFLNITQISIAKKFLKQNSITDYAFFGGNGENSNRNILIFYPDKLSIKMVEKNYSNIVSAIRIKLPQDLQYEHRIYLSGIMKLGLKREKIGDILVRKDGADIIVLKEISEFLENNLKQLTRFKRADISIIKIEDVIKKEKEFKDLSIIVSSMRLDSFVSELARCSRNKAIEIINEQRVFINDCLEIKSSKKIISGDCINIRGKGKFLIGEIIKQTKSNKLLVDIKKYI